MTDNQHTEDSDYVRDLRRMGVLHFPNGGLTRDEKKKRAAAATKNFRQFARLKSQPATR